MKKLLLFLFLFLCPMYVFSETDYSFESTKSIIKEQMKAYYMRQSNIQYNFAKATYGIEAPEEATSQDAKYTVCAAYVDNVYKQGLGVTLGTRSSCGDNYSYSYNYFPEYNYDVIGIARRYFKENGCNINGACDDGTLCTSNYADKLNSSALNNNFLIYYQNTKTGSKVKYVKGKNENDDVSSQQLAEIIQPGDIFVFSGHVLVAYDRVLRTDSEGNKYYDVLLTQTGDNFAEIKSRVQDIDLKHYYGLFNNKKSRTSDNRLLEHETILGVSNETNGAIGLIFLSANDHFVKKENNETKLDCQESECVVIRPFYKCSNQGSDVCYNFEIDKNVYNNSILRTIYPSLKIEKTVNVFDNNGVYLKDRLTYNIKITNNSTATYDKFYVTEALGNYVKYESCSSLGNCIYSNNVVKFTVDSLKANESIDLKYTVSVKNDLTNINEEIVSTGKFYKNNDSSYISTGTVKNKIISKPILTNKTYNECFNNKTSKSGLELINEIYKCVYNIDYKFNTFSFNDLYTKSAKSPRVGSNKIVFNSNMSVTSKIFKSMIYNNYWNGITSYTTNNTVCNDSSCNGVMIIPRFSGDVAGKRAKTIYKEHFKDGDILIYRMINNITSTSSVKMLTKEDGYYAYIFLNGKFIGVNGTGETRRDEFTYNYYNSSFLEYTLSDCDTSYTKCLLYGGRNTWTHANFVSLSDSDKNKIYDFANYQSLFDKNDYVILRPSLIMEPIYKLSKIAVDTEEGTLKNLLVGTKVKNLYDTTENRELIEIYSKDNTLLYSKDKTSDVLLSTGQYVRHKIDSKEYTISVNGDVTGDGKINSADLLAVRKHLLKIKILKNEYFIASDINKDNKINSMDLLRVRKHLLGIRSITN